MGLTKQIDKARTRALVCDNGIQGSGMSGRRKDRRESGRSVDMNTDDAIHLQSVLERHLLVALATALRSFLEPRNQLVEMRGSL
jgi:hypothetical protein